MATTDLKDAYLHIDIVPCHRKFLRFAGKDTHVQFKSLPFGLSAAPRVFTKTMVVVAAHFHLLGIVVFLRIDDLLVVADSERQLKQDINTILHLDSLGFQVNLKKSNLQPFRRVHFIGAVLDSVRGRVYLPVDIVERIAALVSHLQTQLATTALFIQQLLGHMEVTTTVLQCVRYHMHPLQLWFL